MADVIPHFCTGTGCEALHGGSGEHPEVKIAKINADRDVEVAKIQRAESREFAEAATEQTVIEAEAAVAETVIKAEAAVDEAVVENEVLEEIVNPEPEPVVVVQQDAGPEEDGEAATPPEKTRVPAESTSKGWWSNYS